MKIRAIVWAATLSCLLFSCSNGLLKDPRLYNAKKAADSTEPTVAPEPALGLTGGVDAFDNLDEWYNNPNSNGDENNPDKEDFPHTDFDKMSLVGTYFNNENVPVYAMQSGDVWVSKDAARAEFVHAKAPDTEGQGYGISNVHWYQYRGRNPLYAADGTYNSVLQSTSKGNPRLSRFYFYRFTGDTLSPSLDNFLFAVDSYSKLMFAFAKPTASKSVFGNNVPTAWGPTDSDPYRGTVYQFYMYDPVGYVEKVDGKYNVVMYQWFKDNLAKGVYQPTLGAMGNTPARKDPDGAGASPFNNHKADYFVENMKLLDGIPFYRREVTADGGNGLVLYKYVVSSDGKTITRTAESWNGLSTTTSLDTVTYTVVEGETATKGKVSGGNSSTLELADESRTLKFSNGEVAVSNFTDPGPAFIERVKHNPTYENGKTKYVFSEDGTILTMTYIDWLGREQTEAYSYSKQETNSQARYSGYLVQLYNKDKEIRCSTVASVAVSVSVMEWPAFLKINIGSTFTETVKTIPFSVRSKDDAGLVGDTLYSIIFDSDGTKATIKKTVYNGSETSSEVAVTNGSSGKEGQIDSKSVTLSQGDDGSYQFTYDGKTYYAYYSDPGPAFIYRVRGKTYVQANKSIENGYSYSFDETGRVCTYKNPNAGLLQTREASYMYQQNKDQGVSGEYVYAVYGSYFVDLTKGDSVLRMENTTAASDYWAADMEWEAILQK